MSSLVYKDLLGTHDIVSETIRMIRSLSKEIKFCLRFSGGKDSVVAKWLLQKAGVPFEAHFSRTSVDSPELLQFVNRYHSDVIQEKNRQSMFQLIVKKGFPPTRICRYCCTEFKERLVCPLQIEGRDVFTITGVRKQESRKRRSRSMIETCQRHKGVQFYHPIIKWSDEQIWELIEQEHIPYCSLYDEGFTRIGCIGCPCSSPENMEREFRRWPQFEKAYLWAFDKMLEGRHFDCWKNKYEVLEWYIHGAQKRYKQLEGQMCLYEGDYYECFERRGPMIDDGYIDNIPAEFAAKIMLTA